MDAMRVCAVLRKAPQSLCAAVSLRASSSDRRVVSLTEPLVTSNKTFVVQTRPHSLFTLERYAFGMSYTVEKQDDDDERDCSHLREIVTPPKKPTSKSRGWKRVPVVYSTGVVVTASNEETGSKKLTTIAVYWGENSPLNFCEVLEESSAACAEVEAVCLALKQAVYELCLPRVVVRLGSKALLKFLATEFTPWAKQDFIDWKGNKMADFAVYEELRRLLILIEARFEYFPIGSGAHVNPILKAVELKDGDIRSVIVVESDQSSHLKATHSATEEHSGTGSTFHEVCQSLRSDSDSALNTTNPSEASASGIVSVTDLSSQLETCTNASLVRAGDERTTSNVSDVTAASQGTDQWESDLDTAIADNGQATTSLANTDRSSRRVVYTCGVFRHSESNESVDGRAACSVHWPGVPSLCASSILSGFPVTRFRCQLKAIVDALEMAVKMGFENVVVRTDCASFGRFFSRQWRTRDGSLLKNADMHKRILNLSRRIKKVTFEYDASSSSTTAKPMCEARAHAERALGAESDADCGTHSAGPDAANLNFSNVNRIYLFRQKMESGFGYFVSSDGNIDLKAVEAANGDFVGRRFQDALLRVLEQAVKEGKRRLEVHVDSSRFLKTTSVLLPEWQKRGWVSTVGKPLANMDDWKRIAELLIHIEVQWRLKHLSMKPSQKWKVN